jgi:hypothetical protein
MAETIQSTASRLEAFIAQNFSDVETGPGSVINELLIKLAASIQNEQYNKISELSQSHTFDKVLSSSVDTYSPIIDAVASNYNATRETGDFVRGKIKITVSKGGMYTFQESSLKFTNEALGLTYKLEKAIRVSSTPIASLDEQQIYKTENGLFYYILPVIAEGEGSKYQINAGARFSIGAKNYIANFVSAEAYGNFSSANDTETDKQLISRIKTTLGNSRFESAAGIYNKFKSTFSGFQNLSVCGANDPEMLRSKQNVLGISTFGKADVYVRSSIGLETKKIIKPAKKTGNNFWRINMLNSDVPGFYNIRSILPVSTNVNLGGTINPSSLVYSYSLYSPDQRNNELSNYNAVYGNPDNASIVQNARFTKYQTAAIEFESSYFPEVEIDKTASFEVTVAYQPFIADMQNLMLSDSNRLACADYLVKAVVPCMVSLNIKLLKKRVIDTYESLKLGDLKAELFNYINTLPFGEDLQASNIVDICHNYDIKRVDLPISMTGLILCPDGSSIELQNEDILTIPNLPKRGVSPKTTMYFIDYYRNVGGQVQPIDNIGLSIV